MGLYGAGKTQPIDWALNTFHPTWARIMGIGQCEIFVHYLSTCTYLIEALTYVYPYTCIGEYILYINTKYVHVNFLNLHILEFE